MGDDVRVAGVVGSLREDSYTRVAVGIALTAARDVGARTECIDLREYEIPPFNADDAPPDDVEQMAQDIRESDAILLGTPMYHGSYAGVLKNAIDHCGFDEFENKTVGLLAVSGGAFPLTALEHLRSVCRALNAWVLPWEAAIPRASQVIEEGRLQDAELQARVERLGRRAVEYARIDPHQASMAGDQNVGAVGR